VSRQLPHEDIGCHRRSCQTSPSPCERPRWTCSTCWQTPTQPRYRGKHCWHCSPHHRTELEQQLHVHIVIKHCRHHCHYTLPKHVYSMKH